MGSDKTIIIGEHDDIGLFFKSLRQSGYICIFRNKGFASKMGCNPCHGTAEPPDDALAQGDGYRAHRRLFQSTLECILWETGSAAGQPEKRMSCFDGQFDIISSQLTGNGGNVFGFQPGHGKPPKYSLGALDPDIAPG